MINLVRKVVAGPKNTTTYEGQQLDLTYITDRVIAMAYPASQLLEKTYRNDIQDVADYFQENHRNHYLIINVSSRSYDYAPFHHNVKDYEWPDHQAPPFTTLIQVAYDMYAYLRENSKNVVAVHCNHGKGRTGTAIIALLLFLNFFKSAQGCLQFYNSKRFSKNTYGVDQPCQLRYLTFIEQILSTPKINPRLVCYRLRGITFRGLNQEDYLVNISLTRTQDLVHDKVRFNRRIKDGSKILMGDIFIELLKQDWSGKSKVARVNYNLYFLEGATKLRLKGDKIKVSNGHFKEFEITLHFEYYCLCHLPTYQASNCHCRRQRLVEQQYWNQMIAQINCRKHITKHESIDLLYSQAHKSPETYMSPVREKKPHWLSMDGRRFRNKREEKIYERVVNYQQKRMLTFDEQLQQKSEPSEKDIPRQRKVIEEKDKQFFKMVKLQNGDWSDEEI